MSSNASITSSGIIKPEVHQYSYLVYNATTDEIEDIKYYYTWFESYCIRLHKDKEHAITIHQYLRALDIFP